MKPFRPVRRVPTRYETKGAVPTSLRATVFGWTIVAAGAAIAFAVFFWWLRLRPVPFQGEVVDVKECPAAVVERRRSGVVLPCAVVRLPDESRVTVLLSSSLARQIGPRPVALVS